MRTCSHPEAGKRREVATAVAAKTREIRTSELFNKYDITDEEKALPEAEVHPRRVCKEVARNAYYLLALEDSLLSGTLSLVPWQAWKPFQSRIRTASSTTQIVREIS